MKPTNVKSQKEGLEFASNVIYYSLGILFALAGMGIALTGVYRLVTACVFGECDLISVLLNLVSHLIISVAIFDVGRYLVEEEVFRERELRSPEEARRSLTKFMVIVVIAVTLEALLNIIKASTTDITLLVYPSLLFFASVSLLVGLGAYQRLSTLTEVAVQKADGRLLADEEGRDV